MKIIVFFLIFHFNKDLCMYVCLRKVDVLQLGNDAGDASLPGGEQPRGPAREHLRYSRRCHHQYGRHGAVRGGRCALHRQRQQDHHELWQRRYHQVRYKGTFVTIRCVKIGHL